jgi:hypothetical protein
MFSQSIYYLRNKRLKNAGVQTEYTDEQVKEYEKCYNDPEYFIEKYVKIINVDRGLISFEMYPWQKEWLQNLHNHRFNIAKIARQSGKSILVISYFLWLLIFRDMQSLAILANKAQTARKLLSLLKTSYEHLPLWLQQGIVEWNKGSIELENGSNCIANSTASSAGRGGTYNCILLDELAFVPNNVAEDFFRSVYPTISSGKTTKVIMVSTPHGMNMFYKFWTDAVEKRNSYAYYEADWRAVPWRDEKWYQETLANMGEIDFNQEFMCEFIGSQNTLICAKKLKELVFTTPVIEEENLKIYKEPIPEHKYVTICDTSRGGSDDYSTFTIIDITEFPYIVCAVYKNNTITPILYPEVIRNCSMKYNEAFVLIECNDVGSQVSTMLSQELEYENILTSVVKKTKQVLTLGGGYSVKQYPGVQTTRSVKAIGCSNLKSIIESDQLIINDFDILSELTTFIKKRNSFEADEGCHDDLVMNLVLFGWAYNQDTFKDLNDSNLKEKLMAEREQKENDSLLPFGEITNGSPETEVETFKDESGNLWTTDLEHLKNSIEDF